MNGDILDVKDEFDDFILILRIFNRQRMVLVDPYSRNIVELAECDLSADRLRFECEFRNSVVFVEDSTNNFFRCVNRRGNNSCDFAGYDCRFRFETLILEAVRC